MSQKAISDALSKKADLTNSQQTIRAGVTWTNNIYLGDEAYELSFNRNGDLTYNGDKVMVGATVSNEVSLVQNIGQSTTSVMSQKAVSDIVDELEGNISHISHDVYGGNSKNYEEGKKINTVDGELIDDELFGTTPFIEVDSTKGYKFYFGKGVSGVIAQEYKADKSAIKGWYWNYTASGVKVVNAYDPSTPNTTMKQETKYIRFCFLLEYKNDAKALSGDDVTLWKLEEISSGLIHNVETLKEDVDNLNLEVEIAGVSITKYDFNNLQNGYYSITSVRIDPVLKQNDYYRGIIFHVNKGDDVVVSTYGGGGGVRAWGLSSENYTLIARSEEDLDCRDDKRVTLHISEDGYCAVNLNTLQDNGKHFYVKHIHISDNKITREIKNDVENITTDLTSLQVDVHNLKGIIEGDNEKQYVYEDLNQSGYYRIMAVGSSPINPVIVQTEYIKGIYFPVKSGDSVVVSSYSNIENGQNCYGITDLSFNTIERASEKDCLGDKAKTLSITQDGYVFVNFFAYQQDTSKFFIKHKYRSDGIIDKVEVVDFLAKVGTEDAEYSIIDGKYIKSQSRFLEYVDNDSFHCSSPIKLNCGDTIIVESNGANQSIIAQLAECNYSGAPIRSIKNYTKAGVENVEYTAKYSCYVVASWYSLNSIKIKKIISGKLKDFSDALSDVDTYKNNVSRLVDFTENPIAKIRREAGFTSIIRNWGFIGDSLSSGVMNYTSPAPAGTVHMYDLSWCQMLCRLTGAEGYNFSYGGQYAKRWVTGKNENGTPNQPERCWEGAKVNPKDGYIIALGENDKDPAQQAIYGCGSVATDVGTYNPETDTDTNANSYAGWMAGIIQRIKSIQPKAPIFIINMPKNPAGTIREEYNKVISDLCDKFNRVYMIDLYKYAPDFYYEPNFYNTYFHPSHPTALGYQWIAWTICTYIDWIIRNNMHDFANQQFVGTQYWHD